MIINANNCAVIGGMTSKHKRIGNDKKTEQVANFKFHNKTLMKKVAV